MSSHEAVLLTITDGVARLTLNEPARLNALSLAIMDGLFESLARLRADKSVRVLQITGAGKAFSAGADLEIMNAEQTHVGELTRGEWTDLQMRTRHNRLITELRELPFPTLAVLNGPVVGGSVGIAFAADIVIAARSVYVYLPFMTALGIVRLIGVGRSAAMTLLGNRISAEQAAAWGMIWSCVDDDKLEAEAKSITTRLASLPAHAALETRALFEQTLSNTLQQQLDYERARQHELIDRDTFPEGVLAFKEKRAPKFPR